VTLLGITVVTGILLVWLQTRHVRRVGVERRSLLADVRNVLARSRLAQQGIDYPVLTGDYRGAPVTVASSSGLFNSTGRIAKAMATGTRNRIARNGVLYRG
jgi:hypothetical protein